MQKLTNVNRSIAIIEGRELGEQPHIKASNGISNWITWDWHHESYGDLIE